MGDEAVLVVKGEERQAVGYWAEGWMLDSGMLEPWKDRALEYYKNIEQFVFNLCKSA